MKTILIGATALLLLSTAGRADDGANPIEVRKALQDIVNDKDKLATFCEAQKLEQEAQAAEGDEHQEKAQLLHQKASDIRAELGLGTGKLDETFADAEQNSEGAKVQEEISQVLTNCDKNDGDGESGGDKNGDEGSGNEGNGNEEKGDTTQ
jgi:hypothetical protein